MALRILLADDSMTAQNMGKKILTDAGFDVVTVSNGAAAVKKLAESCPDIAILDVYMPGYTGLEVCERLKSTPSSARVPVLLSVGKMEPFRPEDGMKVRADGVIIKPFEATDLVTVVDKLAERTYGPDAKSTGVVPPLPPPPAPVEEPAPVSESRAEGLETFTPVAATQPVQQEPGIEFTSVPKAGAVQAGVLDELMPTAQPDSEPAASAAVSDEAETVQPQEEAVGYLPDVAADLALPEQVDLADLPGGLPVKESALPTSEAELGSAADVPEAADMGSPFAQFPPEQAVESSATLMEPQVEEVPAVADLPDFDDLPVEDIAVASEPTDSQATLAEPPQPEVAAAPAEQSASADWNVEADLAEDVALDLDSEMPEGIPVSESLPEAVEPAPVQPVQQAAPFLAPLGKTSFDELDAVMEQAEAQSETLSPVVAEEVPVGAPIADPAEQEPAFLVEESAAEPFVLHEMMNDAPADVAAIAPEELVPAYEATPVVFGVAETEETAEAIAEPSPASDILEEAAPQEAANPDEVLDLGADAAPVPHDPLAFYGLSDEPGDILQNPIDTDDEPIFSLIEEPEIAPIQAAPADEPLLAEESTVDNVDVLESEDVIETAPPATEEIVTDVPTPVVPAEHVPEEEHAPEEVIAPFAIGAVAATAAAAAPAMALAASPAAEPEPEFAIEPVDEIVEEPIEEPAQEIVAEPVSPAAMLAAPEPVITAPAPMAAEPALDEQLVNTMAGRVVDRVVDRLKPILTVMVEEILNEVKKK